MTPIDWSQPIEPVDEQFYAAERLRVIEDHGGGFVNLVLLRQKGRDRPVQMNDFGCGDGWSTDRTLVRNIPPRPVDYTHSVCLDVISIDGELSVCGAGDSPQQKIDGFSLVITRTNGVRRVGVVG